MTLRYFLIVYEGFRGFPLGYYFYMAKKSMIARANKAPKFKSRVVRRCFKCGRPRGYMRDFDMCRICFREEALKGNIPGIKKSSW